MTLVSTIIKISNHHVFFFLLLFFLEVELFFLLIMRCVIYDHVTSWYDLRLELRPRRLCDSAQNHYV
ncbi:hypothetical protein RB653_005868 [Dictyostelium firmibasis]|uniref:Uncharacterized protein n=1 Tax=Dictyostelium firmibasis TaxID=79012 RepID=A0AAN7UAZ7_9MYCE